jgi:hypothetical protein
VVWTDQPAHPLDASALPPAFAGRVPADFSALTDLWEDPQVDGIAVSSYVALCRPLPGAVVITYFVTGSSTRNPSSVKCTIVGQGESEARQDPWCHDRLIGCRNRDRQARSLAARTSSRPRTSTVRRPRSSPELDDPPPGSNAQPAVASCRGMACKGGRGRQVRRSRTPCLRAAGEPARRRRVRPARM